MFSFAHIGPRSTFLVSGGGRGITAACVIGLARRFRCRFILLGRTSVDYNLPAWAANCTDSRQLQVRAAIDLAARGQRVTPLALHTAVQAISRRREVETTLSAIRAAGGRAEYVRADVTDGPRLWERLQGPIERLGPVTAMLHGVGRGTGSTADAPIKHKAVSGVDRVFATKVHGLQHVLACVPPSQLDALILFTSAATFIGSAGQTDAAIANEILNKIGHRIARTHPTCRVISFNWGPWEGGTVNQPSEQFAQHTSQAISVDGSVQALVDALAGAQTAVQVLVGRVQTPPPAPVHGPLHTYRLRRRLTLDANPFLRDHVLSNLATGTQPTLPMAYSVAWIANAAEGLYPGYQFFAATDHRVLQGITFQGDAAREYSLFIEETRKDAEVIELSAVIRSTSPDGEDRCHYAACIELRTTLPAPPHYSDADLTERDTTDGTQLFHRKAISGIERVLNVSPERVTMRCLSPRISERDQGQFPIQTFNPYLADVQFQSMLVWVRRYHGTAGVSLSARRAAWYRTVPPGETFYVSLEVRSHTATTLVGDIIAHDADGRIYTQLFDASVSLGDAAPAS